MTAAGRSVLVADRVVTAGAVHSPGWVLVEGSRIAGVGSGSGSVSGPGSPSSEPPAGARVVRLPPGCTIVPGFVDTHVHGGGGGSYTDGDRESALRARAAHLARGTTTSMASLVAASTTDLLSQVRMLSTLVRDGVLRGIHLEGPWLSPARAGAHDPAQLRPPDPAEIDALLSAAGGTISLVTIAPELPGAIAAIRRFVDAGTTIGIGHTDASYECVSEAIEAGATVATHLFNAMRPLHHREPGPVLALLEDPRVTVELIGDGVHLHPALFGAVATGALGAPEPGAGMGSRVSLVTDAMEAAVCHDGVYRLGELDVEVSGGIARLAGSDTIAGSTATMDRLFRAAVAACSATTADEALVSAVRMASTNPARALGWEGIGDLAPDLAADLVVLDPALEVVEVMLRGDFIER